MIERFSSSPAEVTPLFEFHFLCDLHLNLPVSVTVCAVVFTNNSKTFPPSHVTFLSGHRPQISIKTSGM